jgi:hypothetical protein
MTISRTDEYALSHPFFQMNMRIHPAGILRAYQKNGGLGPECPIRTREDAGWSGRAGR